MNRKKLIGNIKNNMTKKSKITQKDIGYWATVDWDDIGKLTSLITEITPVGVRVFEPATLKTTIVDPKQITEIRGFVKVS